MYWDKTWSSSRNIQPHQGCNQKRVSAFGVSVEDSVVKVTHRKGLFHDFQSRCTWGWGQAFYNLLWSQANDGYAMPLWIVEWISVWISWLRDCMIWFWYAWEEQVMGDWHPRQCHVAIYCKVNWVCFLLYTIEQVYVSQVFFINFKPGWGIMLGVEILLFIEIPSKGNRMLKIRSSPLMWQGLFPFLSTFSW